jgi:photosystem II stability/assembly factor-like uncharacterized protein
MTTSPLIRLLCACIVFSLGSSVANAEWIVQDSPLPKASFRAVQAVNARVAWIGGSGGACLRTVDGGQTWQVRAVPTAEALDFRGLVAFDRQTALLVSAGPAEKGQARIYRTADGGETWQLVYQTHEQGVFLDGVAFWDARNGLVFGDPVDSKWYLLRTRDGGRTWQRIAPENLPPMLPNEAAFAASNTSLIVQGRAGAFIATGGADRTRVFISANRGEHWDVIDTPMPGSATAGIYGLRFWDARHGIGVGGDFKRDREASNNAMLTSDAGRTWQKSTSTDPPGLKEAVIRLPDTALLAVGPSGTSISRDSGRSWRQADALALHAASCAKDQCWAVGNGLIAKWNR